MSQPTSAPTAEDLLIASIAETAGGAGIEAFSALVGFWDDYFAHL